MHFPRLRALIVSGFLVSGSAVCARIVPNDEQFPKQANLVLIRMPEAWDLLGARNPVTVAVLDTGRLRIFDGLGNRDHPDLAGPRLLPGYDFVTDPASAEDGDGRDNNPDDASRTGHGLHVTGIIASTGNNGQGIAGIDWQARVLPVRVLSGVNRVGTEPDIADGIRWAVGLPVAGVPPNPNPAQVLNLSFSQQGLSATEHHAIQEAIAAGALVVAAAGNEARDAAESSPGGLDDVVTVGAAGAGLTRAQYSNHGPRVDLLAPGGEDRPGAGVVSTFFRDRTFTIDSLAGTSQAAAHVSGALALLRSVMPVHQEVAAQLLRASANPSYRCADPPGGCGAGLLDVEKLLRLAQEQARCACPPDRYCQSGQCIVPQSPHPRAQLDGGCGITRQHRFHFGPLWIFALLIVKKRRRRP